MSAKKAPVFANEDFSLRGYAVLPKFFTDQQVALLRELSDSMSAQAQAILRNAVSKGKSVAKHAASRPHDLIVVPESSDVSKVCRYEYMFGHSVLFRQFVLETILPFASDVLGEPLVIFKDKTNEKAPGGGAFGPHQDFAAYRYFEPKYHVTALISIDKADRNNGCVQFAKNSADVASKNPECVESFVDNRPLYNIVVGGKTNGDIVEPAARQFEWRAVETNPHDLVLFNSFVPHYSEINHSGSARRAMFITMNRAREGSHYEHYYREKRANYHDPKFHISTPTWRIE